MAKPRIFPVQASVKHPYPGCNFQGAAPECVYMAAYEVYAHVFGPQPAMVDHAAGCRGGFSTGELIAFLYARSFPRDQWRARVDEAFVGLAV